MDAAENTALSEVVAEQGRAVQTIQQQLIQLGSAFDSLTQRLEAVFHQSNPAPVQQPAQPQAALTPLPSAKVPLKVALPDKYAGDPNGCEGFLLQCAIYFSQQLPPGPSEHAKVMFITSLLTGSALKWATALWSKDPAMSNDYGPFLSLFSTIFGPPQGGREAGEQLMVLKQGRCTVSDYALTFRTLAVQSGWNEASLITAFRQGLSADIQTELACRDDSLSLDDLIKMATRLDVLLRSRRHTTHDSRACVVPNPVPLTVEEPMQIGHAHLSMAERRHRLSKGLCLYSGKGDHFRSSCPIRPRTPPGDVTQYTSSDSCADTPSWIREQRGTSLTKP
ncbi:hypothetical protein AOLI_G00157790 [Acnodon oligacanthus]